ncbi:MAG TPA: alpha/beta fold hydrolase [Solirubrobacteraceae bacterium]
MDEEATSLKAAAATKPRPAGRAARSTAAGRAALDVLLTDAAVDSGTRSRFVKPGAAAKVVAGLARHPNRAARRATGLGGELARVAAGRSTVAPAKGDRRFGDPAWEGNGLLRRVLQGYLATGRAVDELISDSEVDWRTERQARFAAANVADALAPTNFPWSNPAVIKDIVDHGGASLRRGMRQLAGDVLHRRLPASVDTSKFAVGENLAVTPGAVVLRTEVFELIQYEPRAEKVREVPILVVPPTINKYYILDLAPGRSLIEHLLEQGHQVFGISWRNPDAEQGHFDLDTYAAAVLEAREAVAEIARHPSAHVMAACSGGIISSGALGHLAAKGRLSEVASLTLLVCALDQAQAGTVSALASRELAAAAVAESARKGYLDGQALAGVFAWLRPNDLIWNYWVSNYLLGRTPPAFDILYWNQDTVRLAAGLHRDFIKIALDNLLTRAGAVKVLGTGVDLHDVDVDTYFVAGLNDHIVPWENAYRSTLLFGGATRFVLSSSGHIQALINPPAPESRASHRVSDERPADEGEWLDQAATRRGSWWPDYVEWLGERSGDLKPAKKTLGSRKYKATAKAPGSYVHAG